MDKVGNRYALLERLGSGAMGVVWRAHDELLHRDVAIKQLLLPDLDAAEVDEACRRAMREARIAARLRRPNAVGVFDVVVEDDKPCLVMEFVPSRSLAAVLAERGSLPPAEVAAIGGHVASALAAAHRAGVVHRDIKPGNVLVGHDGTIKITDFGISRAVGDVTVTRTGMLAGTLAYLAPELARGAEPSPPADVFSLGATLYALVEGKPPFGTDGNDLGLLHRIAGGHTAPPTRAGALTPVLLRLLANDPSARPTAEQAGRELVAVAQARTPPPTRHLPPTALPHTPFPHNAGAPGMPPTRPSTRPPTAGAPPSTGSSAQPPTAGAPGMSRTGPSPHTAAAPPHGSAAPAPTRRWVVPAVAAAVAVAATALLVALLNGEQQTTASDNGTSPTASAEGPATPEDTAETTSPPSDEPTEPTGSSEPTESSESSGSSEPSVLPDAAAVTAFVRSHFAHLPHDPATARENWAPENKPSEGDDDQHWAAYSAVAVSGEPEVTENGATYTVRVTLRLTPANGGEATTAHHRMIVVWRDDRLLVVDLAQS